MAKVNNYTRGNIYRNQKSLEILLEPHFEDVKNIVGAEAFLIAVAKEEDSEGAITSDLVYFGVTDKEIFLFGSDELIAKVPTDKILNLSFKEIENPLYYFPPQIPPKRAGLFELDWRNSDGHTRKAIIMFPPPGIFGFELEYPSQKVHLKLSEMNKTTPFYSNARSEELESFCNYLLQVGIPNEVNTEPCEVNEFLGYL